MSTSHSKSPSPRACCEGVAHELEIAGVEPTALAEVGADIAGPPIGALKLAASSIESARGVCFISVGEEFAITRVSDGLVRGCGDADPNTRFCTLGEK
jgi:hypothetical protein